MTSWIVLWTAALVGIDVGWQPLDSGELEYIIQIEPETLHALRDGSEIVSRVPPDLARVRSYRIRVGHGELPHQNVSRLPDESPPAEATTRDTAPRQPSPARSVAGSPRAPRSTEVSTDDEPSHETASDGPALGQIEGTPRSPQPTSPHEADSLGAGGAAASPDLRLPQPFSAHGEAKPLDQTAAYRTPRSREELKGENQKPTLPKAPDASAANKATAGDIAPTLGAWLLLTVGLAASVGGNLYLVMVTWSQRKSYRRLAARLKATTA